MTTETSTTAVDPVCRMEVDVQSAPARTEHEGVTRYFCSEQCLKDFLKDPPSFRVEM